MLASQSDSRRASQNVPFTDIYDARKKFGARDGLERLTAEELHPGDLVWVEFNVIRYPDAASRKGSDESPRKRVKRGEWSSWRCTLDILYLYLIHSGPGEFVDQSDVGAEEF